MNTLGKKFATYLLLAGLSLLASGCASLDTMIPDEVKYGQLYMLDEVLQEASQNCDGESVSIARSWAGQVSATLQGHMVYVEQDSAMAIEARQLLVQLPRIVASQGEASCEHIRVAAMQNQVLLASLSGGNSTIMLASR